jgi:hypothetical protein
MRIDRDIGHAVAHFSLERSAQDRRCCEFIRNRHHQESEEDQAARYCGNQCDRSVSNRRSHTYLQGGSLVAPHLHPGAVKSTSRASAGRKLNSGARSDHLTRFGGARLYRYRSRATAST